MDQLKNILLQTNTHRKEMVILISVLTLMFGYFIPVDYIIAGLFIVIAVMLNLENLFYFVIFGSIFDDVFMLKLIDGSIFRIIMIICFIKLFLFFFKNKILPIAKEQIGIMIFCTLFMLIGFYTSGISVSSMMIFVNIVFIIGFSMYLKTDERLKAMDIYKNMVFMAVFTIFLGCVYGIVHLNFLIEASHSYQIARFNGVFEPNFMCTYVNLALMFVLLNEELFTIKVRRILIVFFTSFACLTVSMSGIGLLCIIYLVYLFQRKQHFLARAKKVFVVGILTILSFFIINTAVNGIVSVAPDLFKMPDNAEAEEFIAKKSPNEKNISSKNPLILRIESLLNDVKEGNWASLSSGRTSLVSEFYDASMNRKTSQVLFGNGLDAKTIYSKTFGKVKYAHNTYIDFLYSFGVVGSIIMALYLARKTIKGTFLELEDRNIPPKMRLIRLAILFSALTLTLYGRRFFILLFLI